MAGHTSREIAHPYAWVRDADPRAVAIHVFPDRIGRTNVAKYLRRLRNDLASLDRQIATGADPEGLEIPKLKRFVRESQIELARALAKFPVNSY